MPPLPTSLLDEAARGILKALDVRINALQATDGTISRLRACKDSRVEQQRLAVELREDVEDVARLIEVCDY